MNLKSGAWPYPSETEIYMFKIKDTTKIGKYLTIPHRTSPVYASNPLTPRVLLTSSDARSAMPQNLEF
jgi:hypothetical protein